MTNAQVSSLAGSFVYSGFRLFIGVAEVLAAVGLICTGVTRILPFLTAWAAAGLMIVMGSAIIVYCEWVRLPPT